MVADLNAAGPADRTTTILIVDDEFLGRAPLVDEFLDLGYRVLEASSADEALGILRSGIAVDVVITDIRMPGSMDGIGLAHRLRSAYMRIHVILMSSSEPDLSTQQMVDGYFRKPFALTDIRQHVERIHPPTVH